MKQSPQPRATAELSKSLDHQLNMYALAASAAGVGLALALPAEAKIIYTPTHAKVVQFQPLPVDLNHDRIVDIYLWSGTQSGEIFWLRACQNLESTRSGSKFCVPGLTSSTNMVRTVESKGRHYAAALRYGETIQHGQPFAKGQTLGTVSGRTSTNNRWYGPWFNGGKGVKHRYLGIKFKIKGQFHFGWARMTVLTNHQLTCVLTGYAYETIPGKGIIAGKTKGPDVVTMPMDARAGTLGHLALGRK